MSSTGIESMFRLDGRLALVTGASSGLGRHFALTLARAGAHVAVAARRVDALQALVQEIAALGAQALALALDVTDARSVRACFHQLAAGPGLPEVLVNNAGTTITKPLLHQSEDDWDRVMDVNLKGAWLVATEAARRLVDAGRTGSIVNIASILAERQAGGVAPYAISKAGLVQATKSMALELARHGIRVNALLPGYVVTDLNRGFLRSEAGDKLRARIPSRRFGEPEDLDGALLLLASDAGRAISGATLSVDGAHSVSSL